MGSFTPLTNIMDHLRRRFAADRCIGIAFHELSPATVCCHRLAASVLCLLFSSTLAEDYIPQSGRFPPPDTGHYLAGELVQIDPINRRGGLRLDGDFVDDRYDKAQPQQFAMLPFGVIYYNGAPAELRDIPIGTHLHGTFYLPPPGEEETLPPNNGPSQYGSKYNHALLLEDDFSFYQRRGHAWEILSSGEAKLKVVPTGQQASNGLVGEQTFWLYKSVRVWQGRSLVGQEALKEGQVVQLNCSWCPEWRNHQFRVIDVWVDDESRRAATERQRLVHRDYQRHRGLAAVVDHCENQGEGKGIVTVTLFGGMDPLLYREFTTGEKLTICAAEKTLRSYWRDHDNKGGTIIQVNHNDNPPPGSSGIQLRIQLKELLTGFARHRIVRVDRQSWPRVKLPPEERLR